MLFGGGRYNMNRFVEVAGSRGNEIYRRYCQGAAEAGYYGYLQTMQGGMLQFLKAPPEYKRITTFQAYHLSGFISLLYHQLVDLFLAVLVQAGPLSYKYNPTTFFPVLQQLKVGPCIVQDFVCFLDSFKSFKGDQFRVSRPCAYQA